jgi:hypothetical protein
MAWAQHRREIRKRRSIDDASVDLAIIARDSHDRDELVKTLRDRIVELISERNYLRETLSQERALFDRTQDANQLRILRLQRLRAMDNLRINNLTGFIIGHGLEMPPRVSVEFLEDTNESKPPTPNPPE